MEVGAGKTRPRPNVVCVGLAAQDHIWTFDALPEQGGKSRATGFVSAGGGMAATASVAVARLGGNASFWGRAGLDQAGETMRAELTSSGVDVAQFRLFDGAQSSVSGVFVDKAGERQIVNFRGGNLPTDPDWLDLKEIAQAGAVLADPRWPEGAAHAFHAARAAGVATVLDADMAEPAVFELLLPLTDYAIFSEPALAAFAAETSKTCEPLAKIATFGCKVSAVTQGEQGVRWLEAGKNGHHPAFQVDVKDTTGAGDVFHGAWALAIAAKANTFDAARFASAAAALKCTKPTGRAGIPNFEETVKLWSSKT